jgi:type II secretory pathway component PulK
MRHPLYRHRPRQSRKARPRRAGFVLVAVLLVVVVLALSAYQFSRSMTAEYGAASAFDRTGKARMLARSSAEYAMVMLSDPNNFQTTLGSNPYDNTAAFQGIVVQPSDKKFENGRFDIVAPPDYDSLQQGITTQHYGVIDEGGKININALFKLDSSGQVLTNFLMTLPNMTQDVANAIVDWIDPDDDTRDSGAETDYYSGLSPSYQAKNGPLDSLEELLLVKGVTPQLLFGNDQNRNGILDPGEDSGTGGLDQGWSAFITVFSRERNLSAQNAPRINVNSSDLTTLIDQLSSAVGEEMAAYIIGYRLYSGSSSGGSGGSGTGGGAAPGGGGGGGGGTGAPASTPAPTMPSPNNRTPNTPSPNNRPNATPSPAPQNTPRAPAPVNQQSLSVNQNTMTRQQSSLSMPQSGRAAQGANTRGNTGGAATSGAGGGGGGSSGSSAPATVNGGTITRQALGDLSQPATTPTSISSLFSLVNTSFTIPGKNGQPATVYSSPLNNQSTQQTTLPLMLDQLTTQGTSEIPARLNINTASQVLLSALPGLTPADVEKIVAQRPTYLGGGAADPAYQTTAWLLTQANLSPTALASIDRYVSASSQVYRVQGFGYFDGGGPTARIEAVIDTNGGRPRLMYWRDLSELSKAYTPQPVQ